MNAPQRSVQSGAVLSAVKAEQPEIQERLDALRRVLSEVEEQVASLPDRLRPLMARGFFEPSNEGADHDKIAFASSPIGEELDNVVGRIASLSRQIHAITFSVRV